MSYKINKIFINKLLNLTNIVDIIGSKINLKKKGKYLKAICPFHNENNPSFFVNNEKQFYHCFGCGSHGNVIDFLMNFEKIEFIDSIEELALYQNMEIIYENIDNHYKKEILIKNILYKLMNEINKFYNKLLITKKFIKANKYLKYRGINSSVLNSFSIGFSPPGNNIINFFKKYRLPIEIIKKTGLLFKNKKGLLYDMFRERIMFPIRNNKGFVVGFGARSLNNYSPKYLNSPETEIFNKSNQLYGLYEIKKNKYNFPMILIVEGYMDVLTLTQFGILYSVSSLGTYTNKDNIKLLYRLTDHIICCYDGDTAGKIAAWKFLKKSLSYLYDNRKISFMFIPYGEDPDSLIRKIGKKEFENRIFNSIPLSKFLFEILLIKSDLNTYEGKTKFVKLSLNLINQIPCPILRLFLRKELGKKTGIIDDFKLIQLIKIKKNKNHYIYNHNIKKNILKTLLGLIIQYPKLSFNVLKLNTIEKYNKPGIKLFIEIVKICNLLPKINTGQLLENYRYSKFYLYLKKLAIWNHMITDEMIKITFLDALSNLYNSIIKEKLEFLINKGRNNILTSKEKKKIWYLNKSLIKF
ncbi:MAG: DNA primase [Candidatus Makana argininalis]